jgi:deoxyhypusine synthase
VWLSAAQGLLQKPCRCDIIEDVRLINDLAMKATPHKTGIIILGGGVPKHHICNANLMRNGADYAVYINTGQARQPCML